MRNKAKRLKKYTVVVPELHHQEVHVAAESLESALALVKHGEGNYGCCDYQHVIEDDEWEVREERP